MNATHTQETRSQIAIGNTGKKRTPEQIENMRIAQKLWRANATPEQWQKISDAQKGKKISAEVKEKISATLTGRAFTDEHRANLSKAGMGRKISVEQIEGMRQRSTGRKHTPESIQKMKDIKTGKAFFPETRLKQSESGKKAWEKRKLNQAITGK